LEGEALTIHYQRAFHLVDFIKRTTIEDVEKVLLNSPDFTQSEKSKGLFLYQLEVESLEELGLEELLEKPVDSKIAAMVEEIEGEILPEIGTVGEIAIPEGPEIVEVIEPEKPAPVKPSIKEETVKEPPLKKPARPPRRKKDVDIISPEEKASVEPPKKEKIPKKKKDRIKEEQERVPRRRRGEKRFIEERIELEESEHEALIARKAEEEELESLILPDKPKKDELKEKIKKEELEEYVSEAPTSSLFADKLKSALGKTPAKTPDKGKKTKKRRKQT